MPVSNIIMHTRYFLNDNKYWHVCSLTLYIVQLWTFYSVTMVWYLLNLTVLTKAEPGSILSNSVNIRPYLLSKMSIIVLLYSESIYERYMCSKLWSYVQNTNTFSCALLWPVVYSSQFYSLTSRYFGALSIFTGKADTKDFTVHVFTGNAHFEWIWSVNFWSFDSTPLMAVGENTDYIINVFSYSLENHFKVLILELP